MMTVLPISPAAGVYVKANGVALAVDGLNVPVPLCVMLTKLAFAYVFPLIVTGAVPQVMPLKLLNVIDGPPEQPHDNVNVLPVVMQPAEFLTVMAWFPLDTPLNNWDG